LLRKSIRWSFVADFARAARLGFNDTVYGHDRTNGRRGQKMKPIRIESFDSDSLVDTCGVIYTHNLVAFMTQSANQGSSVSESFNHQAYSDFELHTIHPANAPPLARKDFCGSVLRSVALCFSV